MKICKKTITIFLTLIILLYSIIPPKATYAEENGPTLNSSEEAGQIIAQFAYDMVANHASETIYDFGDYWEQIGMGVNYGRKEACKGNKISGYAQGSPDSNYELRYVEDKYFMDCVGFVNFCVHQSLNLNGAFGEDHVFVAPTAIRSVYFEDVTGQSLKPGDIIYSGGHVMIYIGMNGQIFAESSDHKSNPSWQIKFRSSYPDSYRVARIKDSAAKEILRSNTKTAWDGQGASGGVITPSVDDSGAFNQYINKNYSEQVDINGRNNSASFYYNGIPKNGEYLGKTTDSWLFNTINDALDWLLGMITLNIKVQLVGWASIFEDLANSVVEAISDTENLTERITVEDVIYNKVPILDVNMFNFEEAGGQSLATEDQRAEDNIIYMLRQKIASWYVAIRTICIILLLFTLIYLGIRTALSSVASEKAEYKKKLVSWVVSFMIVMFIHYFMIAILQINEIAVGWVTPPADSSASIYDQMRAYAYEIPATKGWTGAIIYVFLVYYLIKLLLFYFKRLLIVYILAIVSPALGIAYSIQRINGKSKALGIWAKEFAFNVLIQFIHALIYTLMMGVIINVISNATAIEIVPYAIILFAMLNFVLKAEDIIKNIFKIQSNSLKSVLATVFNLKNRFAGAVAVGGFALKMGSKAVGKAYDSHLTKSLDKKYDKYKLLGNDDFSQSINNEIEELKQKEKEHTKELNSMAINFAKSQFTGTLALVAGVPTVFEKPAAGIPALIYGASTLNSQVINTGKYSSEARTLASSTNAKGYKYIDDPNIEIEETEEAGPNQTGNGGGNNTTNSNNSSNTTQTDGANNTRSRNTRTTRTTTTTRNGETIIREETIVTETETTYTTEDGRTEAYGDGATQPTGNGATQPNQNETTQPTEQRRTIRKYNTKKNKTYRIPRTVLSWATLGRSEQIGKVIGTVRSENKLVRTVYKTRIEKLSSMSKIITKDITTLNNELDKIKTGNYPPIYYMPKPEETNAQVAINERLREKYREILEKNITQIYGGIDEEKISEHVFFYQKDKVTLKSVEEIAKEYLEESKCEIGEKFSENLNETLREKIIDTVDAKEKGFERIKLKPELEKKVQEAIEENRKNKENLKTEVDKVVTENVKEDIVEKLSLKDLTELISKTLEKKGSVEMNKEFKPMQETLEHLSLINQETKETVGKELYTTEQILDFIMNKDITE